VDDQMVFAAMVEVETAICKILMAPWFNHQVGTVLSWSVRLWEDASEGWKRRCNLRVIHHYRSCLRLRSPDLEFEVSISPSHLTPKVALWAEKSGIRGAGGVKWRLETLEAATRFGTGIMAARMLGFTCSYDLLPSTIHDSYTEYRDPNRPTIDCWDLQYLRDVRVRWLQSLYNVIPLIPQPCHFNVLDWEHRSELWIFQLLRSSSILIMQIMSQPRLLSLDRPTHHQCPVCPLVG